mmetsp:Transcript_10457/g.14436  ORF Transcript_10457/g.14436 Transcript_10457/m.14436 type:complete len:92 (+) Transcript_10457:760-1035(+)
MSTLWMRQQRKANLRAPSRSESSPEPEFDEEGYQTNKRYRESYEHLKDWMIRFERSAGGDHSGINNTGEDASEIPLPPPDENPAPLLETNT